MTARRLWVLVVAVALLIAALAAAAAWAARPFDAPLFYWGYVAYSTLALWGGIALMAFGLILLALWFIAGLSDRMQGWKPPPWAGLVLVIAGGVVIAASFPALVGPLRHQDSAAAGGSVYHLALSAPIDTDSQYLLYECAGLGLICELRYASRGFIPPLDGVRPPAELIVPADGSFVDIMVDGILVRRHPVR